MGYELPAGLGVRMSQPDGEVYVFIGDGTFLMNPTELVTAVQENLKVTVVISENRGYQCIRQLQMASSGEDFGNEFRIRDPETNRLSGDYVSLDLAKTAEGMGARTWVATTPSEVCQARARSPFGDGPVRHRGPDRAAPLRAGLGDVVGRRSGRGFQGKRRRKSGARPMKTPAGAGGSTTKRKGRAGRPRP